MPADTYPLPTWMRRAFPALAFFGGFLWDALTLGQTVKAMDLWLLAGYWLAAGGLLLGLAYMTSRGIKAWLKIRQDALYFALQFCFGGLFSALFIFYFKSSSHLSAYSVALLLGALLLANEFMGRHYGRFTLTWCLLGLCGILLLNFVIPHALGSLHPAWFYVSTMAGAGFTHGLWRVSAGKPGVIFPVWILAAALALSHATDLLPPVPLVKRALALGQGLDKEGGHYRLRVETSPWWVFWQSQSAEITVAPGQPLYCVSSVFAPKGMKTRLYHVWSHKKSGKDWVSVSRIGFALAGGRENGFRGYTYKRNLQPGLWKIALETEDGRTVAIHRFKVRFENGKSDLDVKIWDL